MMGNHNLFLSISEILKEIRQTVEKEIVGLMQNAESFFFFQMSSTQLFVMLSLQQVTIRVVHVFKTKSVEENIFFEQQPSCSEMRNS